MLRLSVYSDVCWSSFPPLSSFDGIPHAVKMNEQHKIRTNENTIKNNDNFEKIYNDLAIINRWQTIEKLGMDLMVKRGLIDKKSFSVNQIVEFLYNNISDISVDEFKLLLKTRNELVHKGIKLSKEEFEITLTIADRIIYALKHKLEKE